MKELFKVIGFIFIIYIILSQESLGCPKVTSLKFEPEPPVPVGKQVKMTVDGIDTAGYEDIKLESWSVDGTKLEVTWIGMGTTATYTFTNTGEKKISIQLSGEDKDKDGKRDMREPYETTIVVYKVAKVTGSPVVIQKDGEKNITVTAILEPECEGLVEWQRKRDNGRWEPLEVVGKTVTLLSTEDVGKYKYRARAKGSDKDEDWIESENLYIVKLKILASYNGVKTDFGIMEDGRQGVQFEIEGIPSALVPLSKYNWNYEVTETNIGTTPSCKFSSQTKTTIATADWYAFPADKRGWLECEKKVSYTIKCKVIIDSNEIEAKEATLYVKLYEGLKTGETKLWIDGCPILKYNNDDKKWHVEFSEESKSWLKRRVESYVYLAGVFYSKISQHEDVHWDQFMGKGGRINLSSYVTVNGFWQRLVQKDLSAETKEKLKKLIDDEKEDYKNEEFARMGGDGFDLCVREKEAWDVSDRIPPKYYWQSPTCEDLQK